MGKDYLGKDQRKTRDDPEKDDKPIQGALFYRHYQYFQVAVSFHFTPKFNL